MPVQGNQSTSAVINGVFDIARGALQLHINDQSLTIAGFPTLMQTEDQSGTSFKGTLSTLEVNSDSLYCGTVYATNIETASLSNTKTETQKLHAGNIHCNTLDSSTHQARTLHTNDATFTSLIELKQLNMQSIQCQVAKTYLSSAVVLSASSIDTKIAKIQSLTTESFTCSNMNSLHCSANSVFTSDLELGNAGIIPPPTNGVLTYTDAGLKWIPPYIYMDNEVLQTEEQICNSLPILHQSVSESHTIFRKSLTLNKLQTQLVSANKAKITNLCHHDIHCNQLLTEQVTCATVSCKKLITNCIHLDTTNVHLNPFIYQTSSPDTTCFSSTTICKSLQTHSITSKTINAETIETNHTNKISCTSANIGTCKIVSTTIPIKQHYIQTIKDLVESCKKDLPFLQQTSDDYTTYFKDVSFENLRPLAITANSCTTVNTIHLTSDQVLCDHAYINYTDNSRCTDLYIDNQYVPACSEGVLMQQDERLMWGDIKVYANLTDKLVIRSTAGECIVDVPCANQSYMDETAIFNGTLEVNAIECHSLHANIKTDAITAANFKTNLLSAKEVCTSTAYISSIDNLHGMGVALGEPVLEGNIHAGILTLNTRKIALPCMNQSCSENTTLFQGSFHAKSIISPCLSSENALSEHMSSQQSHINDFRTNNLTCSKVSSESLHCSSITINNTEIPPYTCGILYYNNSYEWKIPSINVTGSHLYINSDITLDTKLPFHCASDTCTNLSAYSMSCDTTSCHSLQAKTVACSSLCTSQLIAETITCQSISGNVESSHVSAKKTLLNDIPFPEPHIGLLYFDQKSQTLQWKTPEHQDVLPVPAIYKYGDRTAYLQCNVGVGFNIACTGNSCDSKSLIDGNLSEGDYYSSINIHFVTPLAINRFIIHLGNVASAIAPSQIISLQALEPLTCPLSHPTHPLSLGHLNENIVHLNCTCNVANHNTYKLSFTPPLHIYQLEIDFVE